MSLPTASLPPLPTRRRLNWRAATISSLVVFVLVAGAVWMGLLLIRLNTAPDYSATATIAVALPDGMGSAEAAADLVLCQQLVLAQNMAGAVAASLHVTERRRLYEPYASPPGSHGFSLSLEEVLHRGLVVEMQPPLRRLEITFTHPDREMAAKIATRYAHEFMNERARQSAELLDYQLRPFDEELKSYGQRIVTLEQQLASLRQTTTMPTLDHALQIYTDEMRRASERLNEAKEASARSGERWNQAAEQEQKGAPLWELSYFAQLPRVAEVLDNCTKAKVALALQAASGDREERELSAAKAVVAALDQLLVDTVLTAREALRTERDLQLRQLEAAQIRFEAAAREVGTLARRVEEETELQRHLRSVQDQYLQSFALREQSARTLRLGVRQDQVIAEADIPAVSNLEIASSWRSLALPPLGLGALAAVLVWPLALAVAPRKL